MNGTPLALLEVVDRDGGVRHSVAVTRWPLTVGRAIDNDVVLADPHVAAHHLRIEPGEAGLAITVGDSRNGAWLGKARLVAGASRPIAETGEPAAIVLGRTRLRLRLPGHALAPELPLLAGTRMSRTLPVLLATLLLVAGMAFRAWLESDPDTLGRGLGAAAMGAVVLAAVWCGGWALLSRIFTRNARLGWHLRVLIYASLGVLVAEGVTPWLAFAFDAPWVADYAYVAVYAVIGAALYFHLLAVEPSRPKLMRAVGAVAAVVGIGLAAWFNHQRLGSLGEDLYMSHLMPPALRIAKGVPVDDFIGRLAPLQERLDAKAKLPPRGDGDSGDSDRE